MNPEEFFTVEEYAEAADAALKQIESRLDALRMTAELKAPSQRRFDRGKRPIEESPLFGGDPQLDLFGGKE